MSRAGCSRASLLVGFALLLGLVGAPTAGLALQSDQDTAPTGFGLASVEEQNAPRFPSTVTLTADRTRALVGQDVTLTARTNVAIPDNPNIFINIQELDTSYRPFSHACKGAVSVCTVTVSSKQFDGGRPIRFVGQVWNTYTGFAISSDPVTVTWTSPPPAAAKPTATPTRTPTPSPTATATATPDVCSPPLRAVRDSAPAAPLTLFSTPKDQAAYHVDVPLPRSDEFASRRGPPADLRRLAARAGEIELTARYVDRAGAPQAVSWRAPLKSLLACSDSDELRRAMDGETTLVSGQGQGREYLVLRYRALDELERITRDAAAESTGLAPGEEATRGAEYRFPIEVVFHDDGGELARSSAGWRSLDYVVREPVVFVPGTAGSRLAVDGAEVWPANVPSASDRAYWQRLALDEAGNGPTVRATDVFREYGKGALCNAASQRGCVYKRWIAHMDAAGYAENQGLFLLPYDWRVPVERHVGELDAVVDRALARNYSRRAADAAAAPGAPPTDRKPTDRVVLIGHSQGGLIVRDYAADAARAAKVSAVVQLGAPNQGTLKVYRALATTGYTFEAPFMAAEIGKWLARDWPSAYDQLLVGRDGRVPPFLFEADGRPVADFRAILLNPRTHLFCQTGGTDPRCRIQTLSAALLDRAEASHARTPRAPASGVSFYTVLSTDQPTIVGFRRALRAAPVPSSKNLPSGGQSVGYDDARRLGILPPDAIAAPAYVLAETPSGTVLHVPVYEEVTRACGDNLVPVHSGLLEGASMLYVRGVAHGGYTDDPHVQSLIDRILRGVRPAGEPAPACLGGGGSLPQATGEGTSIVAAGSPANLHVYDAQGRHTGLRADDTAETGIPGSAFDQDGGTQQVWLPRADQAVRVELEGVIDATVDLRITTWNGASERRVEYAGLPETAGMRASLGVAPATLGAETALLLDARGDGTQQARRPDLVTSDVIAAGRPLGVDGLVWPSGQAIPASPRSAAAVAAGGVALVALVAVVGVSRRRRVRHDRAVSGAPPASSAPDVPSPPAATAEATGACARCGNPVAAAAQFCARCGSPVSPARCPACRAVLAADARFCSACGTSVASSPPTATAPASRRAARGISGVGLVTVVLLGLVVFGAIRAAPMLVPALTPAPAPPPPGPAALPAPPVSAVVSPTPDVPAPTASPAAASIGVASSRPPVSVGAGPPPSPAATVTLATPSGRTATPSRVPEAPPAASLTQECPFRNDFGYSLRYPAGWHTGEGELVALACSDFAPVPFSDPDRVAIGFRFAVGPFADVLSVFAGQGDVLARGDTTVAGFRAVRLEVESTNAGGAATRARIYAYVIDRRGTAIVAATASDYPGYDANKRVLDAMVASLRLQ